MEAIIALIALTVMEVVLGIDNIIFITILTDRLPPEQQPLARRLGLAAAMVMRIGLLCLVSYIMMLKGTLLKLTSLGLPMSLLVNLFGEHADEVNQVTGRDVILLCGGLFLIHHAVREIHEQIEGPPDHDVHLAKARTFGMVLLNIAIMDVVFSLDSVITAVGMTDRLGIMIAAVVLAVLIMMMFAERVSRFVRRHPTVKMLALSFLILIGVMLVADAAGTHVNKGYIYFAMAFSLSVEALNLRVRTKLAEQPVAANVSHNDSSTGGDAS